MEDRPVTREGVATAVAALHAGEEATVDFLRDKPQSGVWLRSAWSGERVFVERVEARTLEPGLPFTVKELLDYARARWPGKPYARLLDAATGRRFKDGERVISELVIATGEEPFDA
jgi:hypothetical protein